MRDTDCIPPETRLPSPRVNAATRPSPDRVLQLAWGYAPTLIIEAAVQNRLFDVLVDGPLGVDEIARRSGASVRGVRAITDALVGLQLLSRMGSSYALTLESDTYLVSRRPASLAPFFKNMGREFLPAWTELPKIVRSGQPASAVNRQDHGAEFFSEFVESLFPLCYAAARALGEHLGVPSATEAVSVLDLGAGSGVWGIGLAQLSSHVQITAVDWPRVLDVTRRMASRSGVRNRLKGVAGDLLVADFGVDHHIATIGHVLHSEGVDRSRELLRRAFAALAPGGTVAIMDFLVNDERTGPAPSLIFAVNMLVHSEHGDAFTFAEIRAWLEEAGFVNARLLEVPAPSPLVLATKPS